MWSEFPPKLPHYFPKDCFGGSSDLAGTGSTLFSGGLFWPPLPAVFHAMQGVGINGGRRISGGGWGFDDNVDIILSCAVKNVRGIGWMEGASSKPRFPRPRRSLPSQSDRSVGWWRLRCCRPPPPPPPSPNSRGPRRCGHSPARRRGGPLPIRLPLAGDRPLGNDAARRCRLCFVQCRVWGRTEGIALAGGGGVLTTTQI
jgi:hypothetical protein